MENDSISEFCLSKKIKDLRRLVVEVYDPKISHFLELGCTARGCFLQETDFHIDVQDIEPSPVHILAHASPGLCSCQASLIASEADNSSC